MFGSATLSQFYYCKDWLAILSLYLLFVCDGDGKGLNNTMAAHDFFIEQSDDAEYCRELLQHSASQLRDESYYHCSAVYKNYFDRGGVGKLTYKQALKELAWQEKCACPFNDNRFETQRRFIEALRVFREATINFLKGKKKPEHEELSPDEVIELIKKFFAYEVVFSAPQY